MSRLFRRGGSLLVAATLTATTLTGSPASAAAPTYDDRPAAAAADWLTAQLTDGVVHNGQYDFDDIGLTADVAFGLIALGGHDSTVTQTVDAIEPRAHDEWYTSTYQGVTTVYSGSLAKALVLAQASGRDGHSFGGQDLVGDLESHVAVAPPITGRMENENDDYGDANVLGQAYAAQGLAAASSSRATDALAFLLQQQCSDGYFRLYLNPDKSAADQSCDGGTAADESAPDTDATAAAVLALQDQADNPLVGAALENAKTWLKAQQRKGGAFGGGPATEAPNTNSTGLAGQALAALGDTEDATRAAVWVRQHQAVNVGDCTPYDAADLGGLAYDDAALRAGRTDGITVDTADQWRRATSQALPVLQWAPAASGEIGATTDGRPFWNARKPAVFTVTGSAPGEALCTQVGSRRSQVTPRADGRVRVRLPHGTGIRVLHVVDATDAFPDVTFHALGALRIPFTLKRSHVARGHRQVVHVHGMAAHEVVLVRLRGHRVAQGSADADGNYKARFRVIVKPGKAKLRVSGYFRSRTHTKVFRVTR